MTPDIRAVAARFDLAGDFVRAEPLAGGHINDSHIVTVAHDRDCRRYLLQKLNTRVFPRPELVMSNIQRVAEYLAAQLQAQNVPDLRRRALTLVPTCDGGVFWRDDEGACWRACRFVERTRTHQAVRSPELAYQAGRAFGEFQHLLADLPAPPLHETIPDFHNTPLRYAAFERALSADRRNRAAQAKPEIKAAQAWQRLAGVLLNLRDGGEIPERVVHNDAKISNLLFDEANLEPLCVVDLDTVMPGLSLFDFGDMVRSMTSPTDEDERDLSRVELQVPLFEALVRGYVEATGDMLNAVERDHLVFAGKLITLEQAVRFLTDFLNGDEYYKTSRPGHNLDRCRTQFKLIESIVRREDELQRLVERL